MSNKKSKIDTNVVIAVIGLIGTIVAGLLASPLLPKWLGQEEEPSTTPVVTTVVVTSEVSGEVPMVRKESLIFSNDFETGTTSGFAFNSNEWQVTKEKNNPLLELSGQGSDSTTAIFGPNDFTDGYIRFRVNFQHFDGFQMRFRSAGNGEAYGLLMNPLSGAVILGYGNGLELVELENGNRPFGFNEDVWYDVKVEIAGAQMTVWVDENKLLVGTDLRLQKGGLQFYALGDSTVWVDDVEVWQYTYEPQQ